VAGWQDRLQRKEEWGKAREGRKGKEERREGRFEFFPCKNPRGHHAVLTNLLGSVMNRTNMGQYTFPNLRACAVVITICLTMLFAVDRLVVDRVCTQSRMASLTTKCTTLTSASISRSKATASTTLTGGVENRYNNASSFC